MLVLFIASPERSVEELGYDGVVVGSRSGGENFLGAHRLVTVLFTVWTSSCICKYHFSISFIFEVRMKERENELPMHDEIEEDIDLSLGVVMFPVMFDIFSF